MKEVNGDIYTLELCESPEVDIGMLGVMAWGPVGQLICAHVHFLVVSELRPLLPIIGVRLDVDGLQATNHRSLGAHALPQATRPGMPRRGPYMNPLNG